MTVEGAGIQGRARSIQWDKKAGRLILEGGDTACAALTQKKAGGDKTISAGILEFDPQSRTIDVFIRAVVRSHLE